MRLRSECTCHCHSPGVICARHMVACCVPDAMVDAEIAYHDQVEADIARIDELRYT